MKRSKFSKEQIAYALRTWVLLRREGWFVNRKRVRRLHRLEGF
jgi:hypothetical protein